MQRLWLLTLLTEAAERPPDLTADALEGPVILGANVGSLVIFVLPRHCEQECSADTMMLLLVRT